MHYKSKKRDATKETNLQEVFTSNERQYSLIKKVLFLLIMTPTTLIIAIVELMLQQVIVQVHYNDSVLKKMQTIH